MPPRAQAERAEARERSRSRSAKRGVEESAKVREEGEPEENIDAPSETLLSYDAAVAHVLSENGALAFPTDTVWGLGCLTTNVERVRQTLRLKGEDRHQTSAVIVPSVESIWRYCKGGEMEMESSEEGDEKKVLLKELVEELLPGFYTWILPLKSPEELEAELSSAGQGEAEKRSLQAQLGALAHIAGPGPSMGVRVVTNEKLQAMVTEAGLPLVATSLNMHGQAPATSLAEAQAACAAMRESGGERGVPTAAAGRFACIGHDPRLAGESSTVMKAEGGKLLVLRQGSGLLDAVARFVAPRKE